MDSSFNIESPPLHQRLKNVAQKELGGTFYQFLKGMALTYAVVTFGFAGALIGGAALIGVGMYRAKLEENHYKKALLNVFRHEVAAITHKPEAQVDLNDLETAAIYSPNGQKNAIGCQLEVIKQNSRINFASTTITNALMVGIVPLTLGLMPQVPLYLTSTINGVIAKITHVFSDDIATKALGAHGNYGVTDQIHQLNQQSKQGPVSAEKVFGVFVEADPMLKQQIRSQHKEPYTQLPFHEKQELVKTYEAHYHAQELADAINQQSIRPTELGFIAYGQTLTDSPQISAVEPAYKTAHALRELERRQVVPGPLTLQ